MRLGYFPCWCVLWVLSGHCAAGDDWPQWLGPKRDGVWRESGILEKFEPGQPRVVWRAQVSAGYSGPAVAKGRVYVTDRQMPSSESNPENAFDRASSTGVERVLCLNEADGTALWKHEYECRYTISYAAGPRVSPLVSEDRVYTLGAEGNLLCLKTSDGMVIWSRELKKDYGIKAPMWGFAGHPLLDGDRLICLVGGSGSTVVAFHKSDGRELWRALTAAEPGYSSPMIFDWQGKRHLIVFHSEAANSLDPETGKVNWSVPFKSNAGLSVATPRLLGDQLFFTSFYNGSLMLRLGSEAEEPATLWRTAKVSERDTTHLNSIISTPFLEEGHIYGVCSYGQLRCLKAETGERVWETVQATSSGEPVRWGNAFLVKHENRFFLFNEKGDLIIARISPRGYQEISRAHVLQPTNRDCGRPVVWTHPAFANRRVYARNDKELVCLDLTRRP